MKKTFEDYIWLAGSHGSRGSLWQGKDHLLVIEGRGWYLPVSEIYRRVDYSNVQALSVVPTTGYVWQAVAFGLGALLFGLLSFFSRDSEPFLRISLGLPAALLAVLFVVHLVRGPTCACTLQTAVQVLRLRPLNRKRIATPVMEQLEMLCRQHQGAMPPLETLGGVSESFPPPMTAPLAGAKPPWSGSVWVMSCGALALIWGVVLAGELFVEGIPYTGANLLLGVTSFTVGIVALVKAWRMQVPGPLAVTLWGLPVASLLAAVGLYAVSIAGLVKHNLSEVVLRGRQNTNADQLLTALANFRFDESEGWGLALVAIGLLIGLAGLVMLPYGRKTVPPSSTVPPVAPAPPVSPPPLPPSLH